MLVSNAWSGGTIEIDASGCSHIEELKEKVARIEKIDIENLLVLISPGGGLLKDLNCGSVFVYDKLWILHEPDSELETDQLKVSPSAVQHNTSNRIQVVVDGTKLTLSHMKTNLDYLLRQLDRLKHIKEQLKDDVAQCAHWQHYYTAIEKIPKMSLELSHLLNSVEIDANFAKLDKLWQTLDDQLVLLDEVAKSLKGQLRTWKSASSDSLEAARDSLVNALKQAGLFQSTLASTFRMPLAKLNADLKTCEELKSKVAQIIDLPFLYGVLIIENSRRSKWLRDFGPIWTVEQDRRQEWFNHYCKGSVSPLVYRLDAIGEFCVTNLESGISVTEGHSTSGQQDIVDYLNLLDKVDLKDVSDDLRKELGAMKKQFARSMSASISSLMPQSMVNPRPRLSSAPSISDLPSLSSPTTDLQTAAYESRISKLETLLMQARLGSKSHEIDIIRAETRAEAKAEAKAEIMAQKQQQRIEELELRNRELADRLFNYSAGLEAVLNSMGLQTSRVDPETGATLYRVNRVKGLSRRMSPALPDAEAGDSGNEESGHGDSGSASVVSGSNKSAQTPGSSLNDSKNTTMSIEKLMDQTYVDNQVLFEAVGKRFGDVEKLARKLQVDNRRMRETQRKHDIDIRQRVALHSFRPEDLILFLPTRDPRRQPNPWAAFNAGAPHYFLHPNHAEQLKNREYLIARASSIEKHVVGADTNDNPFELPNGVEWFLISIHGEWDV